MNPDNSKSFLGATPATNHYINALERTLDTTQTKLIVVPVDALGNQGEPSEAVSFDWPDNKVPRADFTASRTLAAPGSAITFTNKSSLNTETVTWEFEGGDITTSHEHSPVVTYHKEGVYKVKLTASNQAGETPVEKNGLITISNKVPMESPLLSRKAKATASSYTNEAEAPHFAIDGDLTTKWCATGTPPHELTLDLGNVHTISEVRIDHAQAGGESPDMNTKAYAIEISEDGAIYKEVAKLPIIRRVAPSRLLRYNLHDMSDYVLTNQHKDQTLQQESMDLKYLDYQNYYTNLVGKKCICHPISSII